MSNTTNGKQKINKCFTKLKKLIKESARTPFEGTGKPEPLKHSLTGPWSRRINLEHRLVYEVVQETVLIYSAKGHYN
ncbi:Txe/YoeB family addiction module toxin [Flavobacterium sp. ZT3R18]|uniref:Txe/YoeB family addiction module toxin n=1 Tax=Flavobacterium sp. ZT3R18 TaxID=2594429 RepID=UPI00117B74CC|nr:Txe/YoeB family addiction module toxin [Flavobacterium sp. ZT3R18]TRX35512.1 Txe/YoeB family addiction module toxin [Flavobacterium sp. ZT3R18]